MKDDYYWAKNIADKSERYSMCIMISAESEKCVELMIIDNVWTAYYDRKKNPTRKLLLDRYDDDNEYCVCEECIFAYRHNNKVLV